MDRLGVHFLESFLQVVGEGLVVQNAESEVVFCNPSAMRLLGLTEDQIIGQTAATLARGTFREDGSPFPPSEQPAMVALRTGKPCWNVVMGLQYTPDKPRTWVSVNSGVIAAGPRHGTRVVSIFSDITAHIEAKQRLRRALAREDALHQEVERAQARLSAIMRAIPDLVWLKDPNGVYLACNPAFERFFGIPEAALLGKTYEAVVDPDRSDLVFLKDKEAITGKLVTSEDTVTLAGDGRVVVVETIRTLVHDRRGDVIGVLGVARDITERRAAEDKIKSLMKFSEVIRANAPIGIGVFTPERGCIDVNEAFVAIFGITASDLLGRDTRALYRDEAIFREVDRRIWSIVVAGGTFDEEVPMRHRDGHDLWVRQVAHLVDLDAPEQGVILTMRDVTDRKLLELDLIQRNAELAALTEQLRDLARADPLTGLANRRALIEALEVEFQRVKRFGSATTILMIDIDHFKRINDTYGHEAGDRALVALATLLRRVNRATDLPARFGGEEFLLLLNNTDMAGAGELAERLRQEVGRVRIANGTKEFGITVSIGVAAMSAGDENWGAAVARADAAMYRAKALGRNRVVSGGTDPVPAEGPAERR